MSATEADLWREHAPRWAASLNRRAAVEQMMFDASRGKRPMPTPEEMFQWALKLGTPDEAALREAIGAATSWQRAVEDFLADYERTSHSFATPHDAVRWLVQTVGDAALACHGINVAGGGIPPAAQDVLCDIFEEWFNELRADRVEEWHNGAGEGQALHEFLGMTVEQGTRPVGAMSSCDLCGQRAHHGECPPAMTEREAFRAGIPFGVKTCPALDGDGVEAALRTAGAAGPLGDPDVMDAPAPSQEKSK